MLEKVVEILRQHTDNPDIRPDSELKKDLGLDSLQVVSVVVEIEDALGVDIEERRVAGLIVVQDLLDALQK